ncbi:hypothetical protein OBBRIDRAFT_733929, partial [Obba rivulosa]
LIYFKKRIYVPPNDDLKRKVIAMHHEPEVMGHSRIDDPVFWCGDSGSHCRSTLVR